MRVYHVILIGLLGFTNAQKRQAGHRPSQHGSPGQYYPQASPYAANPYQQAGGSYSTQGNPQIQHGGGAALAKPNYPLLLSDSRTLNNDGTINFQYAADNGLQQGETVDPDGTRRGFYSYPGADGKPITVKYTAGKNGFLAEGDHLPRQPQVPTHSDKDEEINSYQSRGQYTPQPQHGGNFRGGQGFQAQPEYQAKPAAYPQYSQQVGGGPRFQQNIGGALHRPAPVQYSPEGQDYRGISPAGFFGNQGADFGPVNYGAISHSPAGSSNYQRPAIPLAPAPRPYTAGSTGGSIPYSPNQAAAAGPYNGQYDLGNGGQFTFNFNPGQSREVAIGGDYSSNPATSY